jgi:AcrR family transcriptional regulator
MTPKSQASSSTRERILDAALEAFAINGFNGATTKDIARRAKVNEVTVFRLFKSKRALFAAVVSERSPFVQIKGTVEIEPRSTIDEMLQSNVRIVLRTLRQNKEQYLVMMSDAWRQPKTRTLAYEASIKRGIGFLASVLSKLMDAGKIRKADPEIVARTWMGAVQFYFLTTDMLGDGVPKPEEEDRMIRGMVSTFLDGMRPGQGGGQS